MGRLSAAAKSVVGSPANQVLFSTLATVLDFADACPPEDDLSLLVVRRGDGALTERASEHTKSFSAPRRQRTSAARPGRPTSRRVTTTNS